MSDTTIKRMNPIMEKFFNSTRIRDYLDYDFDTYPSVDRIADNTGINPRDVRRILYAMMDLGHVVKMYDKVGKCERFRLFFPEGPPNKSVRRVQPNSNKRSRPSDDSD